jgi:hypothetical protein
MPREEYTKKSPLELVPINREDLGVKLPGETRWKLYDTNSF